MKDKKEECALWVFDFEHYFEYLVYVWVCVLSWNISSKVRDIYISILEPISTLIEVQIVV
jgi:hypothetical protein